MDGLTVIRGAFKKQNRKSEESVWGGTTEEVWRDDLEVEPRLVKGATWKGWEEKHAVFHSKHQLKTEALDLLLQYQQHSGQQTEWDWE